MQLLIYLNDMALIKVYNYKTRQEAIDLVSNLDLEKKYTVKVTCKRDKRSIDQNALYWLWLTCIEQESGNDKNDLHDHFRTEYIGGEWREVFGSKCFKLKSTTDLDTALFTQYLDKIQIFASTELGVKLPDPKDLEFERFKDYYSKYL